MGVRKAQGWRHNMTDFEDHDKTIIKPVAGLAAGPAAVIGQDGGNALPVGTRLGEFLITGLIGGGTFGNVYLAQDYSLGRNVAIKEFMPSTLAARVDGISVSARSGRHAETFAAGLISFINEARVLARFDHPSLVKVHRFWEANGTAYMAMPFYEGQTLAQALAAMGEAPSEQWLKDLLAPLLDALQVIHAQDCFHRDIAPDNILLLKDGRPVLLDFGAARHVIGDAARNPGDMLKPGYASLEQYAQDASVRQGAWTDIYALAAVVRYAIMGEAPAAAIERVVADSMEPLEQAAKGRYGEGFLRAIDRALALDPEKRPQTAREMRTSLGLDLAALAQAAAPGDGQNAQPPEKRTGKRAKVMWASLAFVGMAVGAGLLFLPRHASRPALPLQELAIDAAKLPAVPAAVPAASQASAAAPFQAASSPPEVLAQLPGRPEPPAAPGTQAVASGVAGNVQASVASAKASAAAPRNNPSRPKPSALATAGNSVQQPNRIEPDPPPALPQPAPAVETSPAPEPVKAPLVALRSPIDACGKNRLFLAACITDRCKWAEFTNHPVCVEARAKQK